MKLELTKEELKELITGNLDENIVNTNKVSGLHPKDVLGDMKLSRLVDYWYDNWSDMFGVMLDHLYLLSDAQIDAIKELQKSWETEYEDSPELEEYLSELQQLGYIEKED